MCISVGRLHFYRNNIMTRSHRSLPNQKIFLFITVWLLTECTFSRFNFVQIYTFSRFNANHLAKFSHIIHTSSITFHSPPLCYLFCRWGHGISNRCRCYCWFCPRYFSNRQVRWLKIKFQSHLLFQMYDFRRGPCKARTRSQHRINKNVIQMGHFKQFFSKKGLFSGFYLWNTPNRILNLWE